MNKITALLALIALAILPSTAAGAAPYRHKVLPHVMSVTGSEPVLWVHGWLNTLGACAYNPWSPPGVHADDQAGPYADMLHSQGYTGPVLGVQYYCGDTGSFDIREASGLLTANRQYDNNVPIETLAKDLVFKTWQVYGQYGQYVRIAAHSMGGLITGYALTHAGSNGWPPFLVRSVVTFSTPWGGTDKAPTTGWCGGTTQCKEVMPGAPFITGLAALPLPTDVDLATEGGGPADNIATFAASTRPDAQHRVDYYSKTPVNYSHTSYITDTSTTQDEPCRIDGVGQVCDHSLLLAASFTAPAP